MSEQVYVKFQLRTLTLALEQIGALPHSPRHSLEQMSALLLARIVRLEWDRDAAFQFRVYLGRIAGDPGLKQILRQTAG